jgi:DNA (cytosine-5)-methyltransferase 1
MTYRVLSLFAGIGGFDLGLERTGGFKTVAFCEIEPFAVREENVAALLSRGL